MERVRRMDATDRYVNISMLLLTLLLVLVFVRVAVAVGDENNEDRL